MANITLTITDFEEKVLLNDLLDIQEWAQGILAGKISNCKIRLALQEKQALIAEGATTMPTSEDTLCQQALARPDYKNRQQRETPPQQ